eukprot:607006_1
MPSLALCLMTTSSLFVAHVICIAIHLTYSPGNQIIPPEKDVVKELVPRLSMFAQEETSFDVQESEIGVEQPESEIVRATSLTSTTEIVCQVTKRYPPPHYPPPHYDLYYRPPPQHPSYPKTVSNTSTPTSRGYKAYSPTYLPPHAAYPPPHQRYDYYAQYHQTQGAISAAAAKPKGSASKTVENTQPPTVV